MLWGLALWANLSRRQNTVKTDLFDGCSQKKKINKYSLVVKWAYPVSSPLYFTLIACYGQRPPSNLRHQWSEERVGEVITHEKVNSGSDKANSDKCKEMRKHWGMTKGFSHVDGDQKNVKHTDTQKAGSSLRREYFEVKWL